MSNRTLWREQQVSSVAQPINRRRRLAVRAAGPMRPALGSVLRRIAAHDRYQIELKLGYPLTPGKETRYRIDTYLFLPASLGINNSTYTRTEFYRDIQTYIRMKTPSLLLEQILLSLIHI